jgi:hypothetical protein
MRSWLFELAFVFVRLDHVASFIESANDGIEASSGAASFGSRCFPFLQ